MNGDRLKKLFGNRQGKLLVGLTGTVASGKSTVSKRLAALGAEVICADTLAAKALEPKKPAWLALRKKYGAAAFFPDGKVRRDFLAEQVFSDPVQRKWLESIVHPHVIIEASDVFRKTTRAVTVLDAPLLFEAGLEVLCDITVCVHAAEGLRQKRALTRGWSGREFRRRCVAQMAAADKASLADVIIENSGTKSQLSSKLTRLYKALSIIK